MKTDSAIAYHLSELEIARNPKSPHYAMPEFSANDQAILDIGCGIGQTFVESKVNHGKLLVGVDIDLECLIYGRHQFGYITFVNASAEQLPFRDNLFDLVISRASLPYTNIRQSLMEAERVLRENGRVWFTLHPFSMVRSHLIHSLRRLKIKDVFYRSYVILNGLTFDFSGKQFPFFVKRRYESFQSTSGMTRAMGKAGFVDIWVGNKGEQFVCMARKKA